MPGKTALVVGGSRGIGLELCSTLAREGYVVSATCRGPSPDLDALGVIIIQGVDISSDEGCSLLSSALKDKVDLLVCNAGILCADTLDTLSFGDIQRQFEVNALGPLRVVRALRDKLAASAKVLIVSSKMGSLSGATRQGMYGYRMSKAAANMAGRCLAVDLVAQDVAVALVHPGVVVTDMYTAYHAQRGTAHQTPAQNAAISAEESVSGMMGVVQQLTLDNTGTFWNYNGDVIPW